LTVHDVEGTAELYIRREDPRRDGEVTERSVVLDDPDVLASRSLRALSPVEGDGLSFTKLVKWSLGAGRWWCPSGWTDYPNARDTMATNSSRWRLTRGRRAVGA